MYADVNGTKLYYEIEGKGTPCMLLHGGLGADHSVYRPSMALLNDVLMMCYYDHRGNGRSADAPVTTYNHETFAADADALRKYLEWDTVVMVGWSYGGFLALEYALRYQSHLSHLILIATAPSHRSLEESRLEVERRGTPEQREAFEQFRTGDWDDAELKRIMTVMSPLYVARPEMAEELRLKRQSVIYRAEVRRWVFRNEMPKYDLRDRLQEINVPTLVMAGRHDWTCSVRQAEIMAQGIKGAQLVVFEQSGHWLPMEENEKFCAAITSFVTGAP